MPGPLEAFEDFSGRGEGYGDHAPIGVAVLPCESLDEIMTHLAIFLPSTNVKSMIEFMDPAELDGGLWSINFFDNKFIVGKKGRFAVLSPSEETVKTILGDNTKLTGKLAGERKKAFNSDDLFVWVDVEAALPAIQPFIDQMSETMSAQPETAQVSGIFDLIKKPVGEIKTVQAGLGIDATGIKLHLYGEAKPDSELAAIMAEVKPSTESLLVGLPKEKFVFAAGQRVGKKSSQIGIQQMNLLFEMDMVKAMVDAEKLKPFRKDLEKLQLMGSAYSISVSALPEGPDGLIGAVIVTTCDDSRKWVDALAGIIENGKAMITDEEVKAITDLLELKRDAETIGGVSVHHLAINLEGVETIDAGTLESLNKVVGKEGILIRIAAAGPKHALLVFGGGKARFEKVLKLAMDGGTPLANDEGIKRVTKTLPNNKSAEAYVALDAAGQLIKSVLTVYEMGEMIPFPIPDVNAPISVIMSSGPTHQQIDFFLPMELIIAIKDVALNVMGGMMAQ